MKVKVLFLSVFLCCSVTAQQLTPEQELFLSLPPEQQQLLLMILQQSQQQQTTAPAQKPNPQQLPPVAQNALNMVGSLLAISQDPDNPANVANGVANMIFNFVGIGKEVFKSKRSKELLEKQLVDFFLSSEGKEFLKSWRKNLLQELHTK